MRLSIIIVNYKTPQLVLNCLSSIYKYDVTNVEIIVVDNNSDDDIQLILKQNYPQVIFIQMGYNAGFARANNAAIKTANGENILLLNSDTININDAINKCDELLKHSTFLAAGVQLLNEDGSPQISGNYAMRGGLNYLLPLPYTGVFLKALANIFGVQKPSIEKTEKTVEVDWINGAFLMIKKEVVKKAGLLDEDFFLYAEEAEWCSRIKKNGRLCIFGQLNIFHLQGESSNTAFGSEGKGYFNLFDKKGLQIMLSNFVRIRKQFGLFWFCFDLLFYFFTIPVFFIGALFSYKKYSLLQVKGFALNMFLIMKFIPVIIKNKPFFYKVL
ncbi:MAG: glycosyltransferase family 2 protein [Ferruginibacter sp.]|nr:glycosyltransferase family 2 protein [Ferruginibacter sp.]